MQMRFEPPLPLLAGRLVFELDTSPGLAKTRANFIALCTGEKGMCKHAPNKKLHYLDCPIHRIVKGFVAQGGDVTRGDGSGGEASSIRFVVPTVTGRVTQPHTTVILRRKVQRREGGPQEEARPWVARDGQRGENTNSSQFFVVLAENAAKLAKMQGKYVAFGVLKEGFEVLSQLDSVGSTDGKPCQNIWIGGCGLC